MAKSISVEIEGAHVEHVLAALTERKDLLNKTGADLLKKKLGDAAKPVFAAVEYLSKLHEHITDTYNAR